MWRPALFCLVLARAAGWPLEFDVPSPAATAARCAELGVDIPAAASDVLSTPRYVLVARHADRLPEGRYVSGPGLAPAGYARSFGFLSWYLENLQQLIGWPSYFITLGASIDYDSPINATYSFREMSTVAPLITYLEYLNGTDGSSNENLLYSGFQEDDTPKLPCYLYFQEYLEGKTIMVDWDHAEMPTLFGALLSMPNGTADRYFSMGSDEYDTMFLMNYTGDGVRVTRLLDDGGYESMSADRMGDVFSQYARAFQGVVSGAPARLRCAQSSLTWFILLFALLM